VSDCLLDLEAAHVFGESPAVEKDAGRLLRSSDATSAGL
jgi:hypothetical protein